MKHKNAGKMLVTHVRSFKNIPMKQPRSYQNPGGTTLGNPIGTVIAIMRNNGEVVISWSKCNKKEVS